MSTYSISARASAELLETYPRSTEFFGPKQADRYLDELHRIFGLLADNPRLGALRRAPAVMSAATSTRPMSSSTARPMMAC